MSGTREYVFTEWGATAKEDMEALRSQRGSKKDAKLTSAEAEWSKSKVKVMHGLLTSPEPQPRVRF